VTVAAGALEAVARILDRGGDADDVLCAVLAALHERGIAYAAIRFVEAGRLADGPAIGRPADGARTVPVRYRGERVGELTVAGGDVEFAERLAALISPYVLVGWDTSGEPWAP
jgi:hypothetical protein